MAQRTSADQVRLPACTPERRLTSALLAVVLGLAMALGAPAPSATAAATSKMLSVPKYTQGKSNHCWAASAQMATKFIKGSSPIQCTIVNDTLGVSNCVNSTASEVQVSTALTKAGLSSTRVTGIIASATSRGELNANRPWLYGYLKSGGGGHIVVVVGYEYEVIAGVTLDYVFWNDPADGKRKSNTYAYLTSNPNWTPGHSWRNLS